MSISPRVGDYMARELITLSPEMEINRAASILLDRRISGAPVLDDRGWLIGVLSKKDCVRAALHASYYRDWGDKVADYMTPEVETLDIDMGLVEAAQVFLSSSYRRFPVMKDGRLVGQISRADLLRGMRDHWG